MNTKIKNAVEEFQCSGCISGSNTSCYVNDNIMGVGCSKHLVGTRIGGIGKIFLGMPKGFNRLGKFEDQIPYIFETYESSEPGSTKYNVACWKYLTKEGYTLVRVYRPRKNEPYINIYLENCMNKINCIEITEEDINYMY